MPSLLIFILDQAHLCPTVFQLVVLLLLLAKIPLMGHTREWVSGRRGHSLSCGIGAVIGPVHEDGFPGCLVSLSSSSGLPGASVLSARGWQLSRESRSVLSYK